MSPRRQVLLAACVTLLLLGSLALVLWRMLPPVITPLAMQQAGAVPPFEPPQGLPSALPAARAEVRYAVLELPASAQLVAPGAWNVEVELWRSWLGEVGATEVAAADAEVLVVPDGRCLDEAGRTLVAEHLAAGGGLVTAGMLGERDGECTPFATPLLAAMLGGGDVVAPILPAPGEALYTILIGETVLGAGIPAGAHIEIYPEAQIMFSGEHREAYYSDFVRVPRRFEGIAYFDGAAARARIGPGRLVALGYPLRTVVGEWSEQITRLKLANALRWTAARPIHHLATWPDALRAAAFIAQDVEADYRNARHSVSALSAAGVPATAFIVESLAERDAVTTGQITRAREVGTHTWGHFPLDTMSYGRQLEELDRSKRTAERLVGRPVRGMRPPEERYNRETLEIWAALGGDYIFARNEQRVAAPEIIPVLPDSLVILGRVVPDDFDLLEIAGIRDLARMSQILSDAVEDIVAVGGLFAFSYHSHMFGQRVAVPVVVALGEHLRDREDVWLATAGEIAAWWRTRHAIRVESDGADVHVTNAGARVFERGVLLVDFPDGTRGRHALAPLQPGERRTLRATEITDRIAER